MIGFTNQMHGTEPRVPVFHGPADIVYDGKYLWVSNRDTFGTPPSTTIAAGSNGQTLPQATINVASANGFTTSGTIYVTTSLGIQAVNHTSTNFPTNTQFTGCTGGAGTMSTGGLVDSDGGVDKTIYIFDPTTGIPRLVTSINLSSFNFKVVRSLSLSNDGTKVYACLAANTGTAGRCLIFNKNTFAVIGNAQVTTANIGGGTPHPGGRAVYAADDGADHLWVVNSNQSNNNAVERFSLSAVLANGATATTSLQIVNITAPFHAEELAVGAGFLWSSASDYSTGVVRIDLATGALSTKATTNLIWGPKFIAGAIWGGDFGRGITRINPAAFVSGTFETDHVNVYPITSGSNSTTLGGFAYDGTYIWCGGAFYSRTTQVAAGSNGQLLPQATINVVSTTLFPSSGSLLVTSNIGQQVVFYTGKTGTSFTGCSGGLGTINTNNVVRDRRITIKKFSTGAGTVAEIASLEVYDGTASDSGNGFYNLFFDGTYIWAVQRKLTGILGLIKIDPTHGAEKVLLTWPTGGTI